MAVALENIEVEERGPALWITLNRPDKLNPLSTALMRELLDALRLAGARADVRAIVIRGAGRAFSAGHDLRELIDRSEDEERATFRLCEELMRTVQAIPQPVIAMVRGIATAAGCQLVATCDMAFAAADARFATNGIKNGLFCYTPIVPVYRAVGRKRALYLGLTGEFVSAPTAADWGLITEAVDGDRLEERVSEVTAIIASLSPHAVRSGKEFFYAQADLSQEEAYGLMSEAIACNATTEDAQEGIKAFLEKRQPRWRGR